MSPVQYVLWVSFAVFWICEAIAHFILKNESAHTISHDTRNLAHRLTGRYANYVLAIPPLLLFLDFQGLL